MPVRIVIAVDNPDLILGVVTADGVAVRESNDELAKLAGELVRARTATPSATP